MMPDIAQSISPNNPWPDLAKEERVASMLPENTPGTVVAFTVPASVLPVAMVPYSCCNWGAPGRMWESADRARS